MTDRYRQILDAALAIADEHGLSAVSMRGVAARVDLSPMALYPHVGSKAELLDGLLDRLMAELLPALSDIAERDWRARLTALAQGVRALARRHPAAFPLLMARPSATGEAVRVVDVIYRALLDAGVPGAQVPRVERMVSTFVLGYAASEVNGRFRTGTGAANPRARRARLPDPELPAHRRLTGYLDQPVDWDAEFAADLDDLLKIIQSYAGGPAA